jgi:hypothetical protein
MYRPTTESETAIYDVWESPNGLEYDFNFKWVKIAGAEHINGAKAAMTATAARFQSQQPGYNPVTRNSNHYIAAVLDAAGLRVRRSSFDKISNGQGLFGGHGVCRVIASPLNMCR